MSLGKLLGGVLVLALTAGCGQQVPGNTGNADPADASAPPSDSTATPAAARAAVQRAVKLATHSALAARLAPAPAAWKLDGKRLASPGWRAPRMGVGAHLPATAAGTLEVGPGASSPIALKPEGARDVTVVDDQGRAVYPDAYPSTDLVFVATRDRVEWFLTLRNADAPHAFAWRVTLPDDLEKLRREPSGALVAVDRHGTDRLRIPVPYAVDAKGTRREAETTWKDGELRVALDDEGLVYPVLLDPAVETAVWTQRSPATSPPARRSAVMAYETARNRTLLFGGYSGSAYLGDTWEWDGTSWSRVATSGPSAREPAGGAYDSARGRVVLFGGYDNSYLGDTWEWGGTSWSRVSTSGPGVRLDASMAYDSARGRTVLFGGFDGSNNLGDTWEWNGTSWSSVSTTGVGARYGAPMVYDSAKARTLLFGGEGVAFEFPETWEWDGNTWSQVATTGPLGRMDAAMAYDSARGRTVLFGGLASSTGSLGDTWEWDGTAWTETATTGPAARVSTTAAYDSARRRVVLFGGANGSSLGDTWEYHTHGGACTADAQCDTGHCVDGVCCEQASCGTCEACNGSDPGNCTAVLNAPDPDTCASPKTCGASGLCGLPDGQSCTANTDCASTHCSDGVCCDAACSSPCVACSVAKGSGADGTCMALARGAAGNPSCAPFVCNGGPACPTTCSGNPGCIAGDYCKQQSCVPKETQGTACSADTDCTTGHCADGVCCDTACSGTCEACIASLTGGSNGTCAPIPADSDPENECGVCQQCNGAGACADVAAGTDPKDACTAGGTSCGADGQCDGQGACRQFAPQGTQCGTASCANATASGHLCDGNGSCNTAPLSCGEFKCNAAGTACLTSCTTDTDCVTGAYCDNGTCTTKKAAGATCQKGTECANGYCADGVCCDSACTGQCEACDVAPNAGTCVPVKGTPEHAPCTGAGTDCGGSCDGVNRSACSYPGPEQSCGTPACSNGAAQRSVCDSKGHCGTPTTTQCAPYLCSGTACGTTCSADTDCANGYQCDTSKNECIPTQTGKCSPDKTKALDADGNVVQDCSPLLCTGGHCNQLCAKSGDCIPGYVCNTSNGQCVKPETSTASNSGGCGCRTAGRRGRDGEAPLFLALGLLGLALRRRGAA